MNMSKKVIILTLLVVLVLSAGVFFWRTQNSLVPNTNEPVPVVKTDTPEQKSVRVSDGEVIFSFQVPKDWLVETRNAGEKPMTESELREFLATSYQNDPKASPDRIESDYAYLTWNQLQKMTLDDMKGYMAQREKEVGVYPNASVASSDSIIGYRGPVRQIDFYITSYQNAQAEFQKVKNEGGKVSQEVVGGMKAEVENYAIERDDSGNPQVTIGASGGKKYYVFFPELKKALLIDKQFLGDEDFEADFQQVVQTLKFSK